MDPHGDTIGRVGWASQGRRSSRPWMPVPWPPQKGTRTLVPDCRVDCTGVMAAMGQQEDIVRDGATAPAGSMNRPDPAGRPRPLGGRAPEGFATYDLRRAPVLGMTVVVGDPYHPDLVRIALSGELSRQSAAQLEALVDGLIGAGVTVRLNLYDLSLCTSRGVAALERIRDRLEALGGSLELVGAHDVVRGVLDIAGFATTAPPA